MSDKSDFGFAKFVPGFDFLQNLAKGTSQGMPQMPGLSNWIAPTLNVEELDKRISELKAVHFWLDQNGKALAATIQALEVQKMTLATLKGMNVRMADLAEAMRVKPQAAGKEAKPEGAEDDAAGKAKAGATKAKSGNGAAAAGAVDPLQWWGALTRQFQEIAANAMKDAGQPVAAEKAAAPAAEKAAPARKAAARKSAPRKKSAPAR